MDPNGIKWNETYWNGRKWHVLLYYMMIKWLWCHAMLSYNCVVVVWFNAYVLETMCTVAPMIGQVDRPQVRSCRRGWWPLRHWGWILRGPGKALAMAAMAAMGCWDGQKSQAPELRNQWITQLNHAYLLGKGVTWCRPALCCTTPSCATFKHHSNQFRL